MVILSYHQDKELASCNICAEFLPIEFSFIAEALEFYCKGQRDLTMPRLLQLAGLQVEIEGAVNEFNVQRAALRKERML